MGLFLRLLSKVQRSVQLILSHAWIALQPAVLLQQALPQGAVCYLSITCACSTTFACLLVAMC
jgi:hypothetical protein